MEPKIFGWEHLTFLAVFVVIMVVALILIKKYAKTEKSQNIIVNVWHLFYLSQLFGTEFRLLF